MDALIGVKKLFADELDWVQVLQSVMQQPVAKFSIYGSVMIGADQLVI